MYIFMTFWLAQRYFYCIAEELWNSLTLSLVSFLRRNSSLLIRNYKPTISSYKWLMSGNWVTCGKSRWLELAAQFWVLVWMLNQGQCNLFATFTLFETGLSISSVQQYRSKEIMHFPDGQMSKLWTTRQEMNKNSCTFQSPLPPSSQRNKE